LMPVVSMRNITSLPRQGFRGSVRQFATEFMAFLSSRLRTYGPRMPAG
jgi:hypothetical protein